MKKIVLEKEKKYSICSCGLSKMLLRDKPKLFNEKNGTNYKSVKIIPKEKIEIEVSSSTWKK